MSNSKIAYVYTQEGNQQELLVDEDPRDVGQGGQLSEYDHLIRYFEQTKDIAYTVLWDVCSATAFMDATVNDPSSVLTTPSCAAKNATTSPTSFLMSHTKFDSEHSCTKDHSNDPSMIGLRTEGHMCRTNYNLSDDTKVFLAIAWVFKPELRYFKLFPEVIHVDGTSHSTQKKYELITFSVKTSLGRQVVFLRVWLPDQKRYSFRWLFQHVLAGLVPRDVFHQTRLVMGDGDRQQQAEIEAAIEEYMPNARFGGCGWHIVDRGWRRNGPTTNLFTGQRKKRVVQTFFRGIRTWVYSWMRPGYCESREEYQVSLRLLLEYINSPAVKDLLDGQTSIVSHLKKFLRENIIVYDKLYLHFLRKDTRFLDVAHNSSHEGTNHGMKSCSAAVLPVHNPVKAAQHMVMQGVIATKRLEEMSSKSLNQRKVWSVLPTSPYLVTTAEDILRQQVGRYKQYSVIRVAQDQFKVHDDLENHQTGRHHPQQEEEEDDPLTLWNLPNPSSDDDHDEEEEQHEENTGMVGTVQDDQLDQQEGWCPPIPRFTRTRIVTWTEGIYRCSCCHFERTGIPCVHLYAVAKMLHPQWEGFTHHDVAVRWWSSYICHAFPCHGDESLTASCLRDLARCDIDGPSIRTIPPPPPLLDSDATGGSQHDVLPAYCRVKNYSKEALHQIFGESRKHGSSRVDTQLDDIGLTQTTFDPDIDDSASSWNDDYSNNGDGVCNLFEESLKQIAKSDDKLLLEDDIRGLEGDFRTIASLLPMVGKSDRDSAHAGIASIISQLRGAASQKKRNSSTAGATQGIVVETHPKRRMYNTHKDYYR